MGAISINTPFMCRVELFMTGQVPNYIQLLIELIFMGPSNGWLIFEPNQIERTNDGESRRLKDRKQKKKKNREKKHMNSQTFNNSHIISVPGKRERYARQ